MDLEIIRKKLKNILDGKRYYHSINVMETSAALARRHGADIGKARLAGILHDCGKNYEGDEARAYVKKIGYDADFIETSQTRLLHGIIGEHMARVVFGIKDDEVLGAIRWHTTGKAGMTVLEKIIYVADYIEPLRSFEGIKEMRDAALEDLDRCVVLCADSTIRYVLEKGLLLHQKTVETRNFCLVLTKANNKIF